LILKTPLISRKGREERKGCGGLPGSVTGFFAAFAFFA
jgi:hypothetical protein